YCMKMGEFMVIFLSHLDIETFPSKDDRHFINSLPVLYQIFYVLPMAKFEYLRYNHRRDGVARISFVGEISL
ncbi:MAG: hypothetical protein IKH16_07785, partial [Selenomonadaceae bacterium]|nr:hypothetical protein [Selenomonadaceae bacterium]